MAVLPLLGYIVLQLGTAVVGLNVVREEEMYASDCLKAWIIGQMLLFAILQVLAAPMIILRCRFDVLYWSYLAVCAVLFVLGLLRIASGKIRLRFRMPELSPLTVLLLSIGIFLIALQFSHYFFMMHLDEDDARWLAEANDAIVYGDMMTRNFDTGEYVGSFLMAKDVSSPWPMMWAVFSRLLLIHPSIFAHTIYASVEVLIMYGVYWLIGKELFDRIEARATFFAAVAWINLFFGGTTFTQSVFSLVRIWQGKATVAAIVLPLLFYLFLCIGKRNRTQDWCKVIIVDAAACLMSGMGVSLAAIVIVVYSFYTIVAYGRFQKIPMALASLAPSVVSLSLYSIFRLLF